MLEQISQTAFAMPFDRTMAVADYPAPYSGTMQGIRARPRAGRRLFRIEQNQERLSQQGMEHRAAIWPGHACQLVNVPDALRLHAGRAGPQAGRRGDQGTRAL